MRPHSHQVIPFHTLALLYEYPHHCLLQIDHKDAEEKQLKAPEIKETKVETRILLKMISGRGAYLSRGYLFTMDEPFVFVPEEIAKKILSRSEDEIREATAEEVKQFYGVK